MLWTSLNLAPSAAFAELQAVSSSAFGEQIDVVQGAITSGPLPDVTLAGSGGGPVTSSVANACVPRIRCEVLRSGLLQASTQGSLSGNGTVQSSANVASSDVATGALTADRVQGRCGGSATGLSGAAVLTGVRVGGIPVAANPRPNTVVSVPGIARVTLNEQIASANSITVNAVHVHLLRGKVGDVILSQAHCEVTLWAPPAVPESPLTILLTLSTMAVLLGVVVWAWRRDHSSPRG